MKKLNPNRITLLAVAALAVGGVVAASAQNGAFQDQNQAPPNQGQFGGPGAPQFGGPGGPGFAGPGAGRFGGPGFGGPMGSQLTATATNVYVLRGSMLYSFDARTLKLAAMAQMPTPTTTPPSAQ